jgi:hypothetical protein
MTIASRPNAFVDLFYPALGSMNEPSSWVALIGARGA